MDEPIFLRGKSLTRSLDEVDARLSELRPWAYRLALAIVIRSEIAEDVAQEALLRAFRSRRKLQHIDDMKAWLRRVVIRCSLDARPRKGESQLKDEQASPSQDLDNVLITQILAELNANERVVLALAYFEGFSYAEIGEVLDIPAGTVASRLNTAREAFRKQWGNYES